MFCLFCVISSCIFHLFSIVGDGLVSPLVLIWLPPIGRGMYTPLLCNVEGMLELVRAVFFL